MSRRCFFALLCVSLFHSVLAAKVLFFTRQVGQGPLHGNVAAAAAAALAARGAKLGWVVDESEDANQSFRADTLAKYAAVVFLCTDGEVLDRHQQRAALEAYVALGGSVVGVHSAGTTLSSWDWFSDVIGARHISSPPGETHEVVVPDRVHPASRVLPERWGIKSDRMAFDRNVEEGVHVLAYVDKGGDEMDKLHNSVPPHHPVSWTKTHNDRGARVFFTALGHSARAWEDTLLVEHVAQGIHWAAHGGLGLELLAKADLGTAGTREDARKLLGNARHLADDGSATVDSAWEKDILVQFDDGDQPMHLAIAPDGRVFFTTRQGELRVWKPSTNSVAKCGTLSVVFSNEDGLLGVALDPSFARNSYIYLYWSPQGETNPTKNVLSRFTLSGDELVTSSEMRLLEIPTQRLICCHSGSGLEFDGEGWLVIGTGDNTWISQYTSSSSVAGSQFDAQSSSGNTNDLRGKILRIKPTETGYMSHPGNMFGGGDSTHRPEIFAMGLRNPFSVAVDPLLGHIYAGDVGPDATHDSDKFGPRGYDEVNQFKTPGNGGWPFCIANNRPYAKYNNYDDGKGDTYGFHDCSGPENTSPHNTGQKSALPGGVTPIIYYSYSPGGEFGVMDGDGTRMFGRAAMVAFFYRFDGSLGLPERPPAGLDNTLFMMDWVRNYWRAITMDSKGNVLSIRPMWSAFEWRSPLDAAVSPYDGAVYVIEFGDGFSIKGGRISRMKYKGAPSPITCKVAATPSSGSAPLTVQFSAKGSTSNDGSSLSFSWDFASKGQSDADGTTPVHTYKSEGSYLATLTVSSSSGATSRCALPITASSGSNGAPRVEFQTPPDGAVFTWGDEIFWKVAVSDPEDGSTGDGRIDCKQVAVTPALGHDDHAHSALTTKACSGTAGPTQTEGFFGEFFYALSARFTDSGGVSSNPSLGLKPSHWFFVHNNGMAAEAKSTPSTDPRNPGGDNLWVGSDGAWASFNGWNLINIQTITVRALSKSGGFVDVKIGQNRRTIATVEIEGPTDGFQDFTAAVGDTNQWLQVDMGAARAVSKLVLDSSSWPDDAVTAYAVYAVNDDGVSILAPVTPLATGYGAGPVTEINFPAAVTRFIRIVQTGLGKTTWWSVGEVRLFDGGGVEIDRTGFAASASVAAPTQPPGNVMDMDSKTAWSTGESQRSGKVDLAFFFRGRAPGASDLFTLSYFQLGGTGVSKTPH